jgi:hypothetical protein
MYKCLLKGNGKTWNETEVFGETGFKVLPKLKNIVDFKTREFTKIQANFISLK